jgi:uncharacterized RDD family membrane protein YckC
MVSWVHGAMNQYTLLGRFILEALTQLAPALLVLTVLAGGWLNPRTKGRFRAALIDLAIAAALMGLGWLAVVVFFIRNAGPFPGAVLGTMYLVFRDAILTGSTERRSIGKKLIRLRLFSRTPGRSFLAVTALRNLPLVCAAMLGINRPWARTVICCVVIAEALLIVFNPKAMRLGDFIANTRVVPRERRRRKKSGSGAPEEQGATGGFGTLE